MALPAMAAVRAALGDGTLIVAAAPAVAPLFEEITAVSPDQLITLDTRREAAQLRDVGADAMLLFTNSFRTAWVSRQARISRRLGYRAHGRSLLLTHAIRKPRQRVHQSEYDLHLVRELGFAELRVSRPRRCGRTPERLMWRQGLQPRADPRSRSPLPPGTGSTLS